MSTIGEHIKKARELRNMTQSQLGEKLGVTGVTVMRYEKGQREPNIETIFNMAEKLNVPVSYLLGVVDLDGFISPDAFADPEDYELIRMLGFDSPEKLATLVPGSRETTPGHLRELEKMMGKEEGYLDRERPTEFSETEKNLSRIKTCFEKMNTDGQAEAVKRTEELAQLKQYQKISSPSLSELWGFDKRQPQQEPPAATSEGRDTTSTENAATGPQKGK